MRRRKLNPWNESPAATLPARAEDRQRFPRETFAITYLDDNGFGIDTAAGTMSYDRIVDPDTLLAFRLTNAEIDSLYDEALGDRMFDMAQPAPMARPWAGADHWGGTLTLEAGGFERSLRWDIWSESERWTDDHKRLNAFVRRLRRMVEASSAYRAQPRPRGAYFDSSGSWEGGPGALTAPDQPC